jgi:tungstate transport system substrate-binding protein
MKKLFIVSMVLLLVFCALTVRVDAEERLRLATTTSTDNSGLLSVLLPPFEKKFDMKVDVIAVGTGAALKLGENGDADVLLVHAPSREKSFVDAGFGVNRRNVMYNDFVIIGPKVDPAGIRGENDASKALAEIDRKGSLFISRGDDSGTHIKEQALWEASGVTLKEVKKMITKKGKDREVQYIGPEGKWYLSIGQGMGAVLMMADEKNAYTLTDRGTYLAYKDKLDLDILSQGDKRLFNPYGIIAVNPDRFKQINYFGAMDLIAWMTSVEGQKIIGAFRIAGEVLFHPTAVGGSKE